MCDALNAAGQSALSLHGDLEQRDRDQTLVRFANGSARVLVATDVAARGLDIKSLELVVNFELAWDPEVHVHRIGRTARAGNSGPPSASVRRKRLSAPIFCLKCCSLSSTG